MSSEIQKGRVIEHGYGGSAESNLGITVAVKNKDTGQWEKPLLDPTQNHAVKGAIETIRQLGATVGAWNVDEGTLLEMTGTGVFVKEGQEWKDILSIELEEGIPDFEKKQVALQTARNTLKAVTTFLGKIKIREAVPAVPETVAANANALNQGEVVIEVQVAPRLASSINGHHRATQELITRVRTFVKKYQDNRELFESVMRAHGISDSQSAFIFNHYITLYKELKKWNAGFQKVVSLVNNKQYSEAMKEYASLVNSLPQLLEQVRYVRFGMQQLQDPQVQKAFLAFASKVKLFNPQLILLDLSEVAKLGAIQQLVLTEYIENARQVGIEVAEGMQALDRMGELIRAEEATLSQFSRLFAQNHRLIHFFGGLMAQPKHPLHQPWKNILKKHGWSLEKIQGFSNLTNQYANSIRSLQQAEQAVAMESDPTKQRALQAQFKELGRVLMPQIDKIHKELQKLGGMNQYRTLIAAANELARKASSKDLKGVEVLQTEALSLVRLMEERIDYISALCENLDLVMPEGGSIASNLLQGPHSRDAIFSQILADYGWKTEDIRQLSMWNDAYMKEVYPIQLAKKNLDGDPENIILQSEFKQVVNRQIPKLTALSREFKKIIGEKGRLEDLEFAMGIYKNVVVNNLSNLEVTVSMGTLNHTQTVDIRRQIGETKTTLSMFSSLDILADFNRTEAFIVEMDRLADVPLSWDEDYLSELIPNEHSPLMKYGGSKGKTVWVKCLEENGLKQEDVKAILKLQNQYQKHLEKIVILERKLEAHPENDDLRRDLIRELSFRFKDLKSLEQKFDIEAIKIAALEQAVQDLKSKLETDVQLMQVAGNAEQERGMREAAKATELAAINLLLIVNKLNVSNAFRQKRDFVADVRKRFTRTVA